MQLKVIGSGLGRTGTKSLHSALNMLGFGPCHHMMEVFPRPESLPLWIAAGEGRPDWNTIFAEFNSAVDYPSAAYWRELADFYPDAKVIHTVRDPEKWFASTQATIFNTSGNLASILAADANAPPALFFKSFTKPFVEHMNDHDFMIDYFHRHNAEVKATIPASRLLVYEAGQGWAPLCAFLGVPVPETPYPSENTTAEFQARAAAMSGGAPPAH